MRESQDIERQRILRRQRTEAEHRLWQYLRNRRLKGHKFRRQYQFGPFFVDFYCDRLRLAIEVDGSQHIDAAAYDQRRTNFLERQNVRVLRVWNNDVLARTDDVLAAILAAIESPHPPFGHPLPHAGEG